MTPPRIAEIFSELGIPTEYGRNPSMPRYPEAKRLVEVEPNIVGRVQSLSPRAAEAWKAMRSAAQAAEIELMLVSGYRSIDRQAELIRRRLDEGLTIQDVLKVYAAPGFSQHHTGRAMDLATPGFRPVTEAFADSPAFAWLTEHGARFGFHMPFDRNNKSGFVYEPWHWFFRSSE